MHGAIRHVMGSSKIHAGHPAIGIHIGRDSSADVLSPLGFLRIQVPLIVGGFAGLTLLQDVVNSGFRQRLVPKSSISETFDFVSAFPALARPATKLHTFVIATAGRGSRE